MNPCPKPEPRVKEPRKPIRKRNRARSAQEWVRAYGSAERQAFVKWLPCIVTGQSPCDNAHTETGGISRKADANTVVPLIREKHRELHRIGSKSFEAKYGIDLQQAARETNDAWVRFKGGET